MTAADLTASIHSTIAAEMRKGEIEAWVEEREMALVALEIAQRKADEACGVVAECEGDVARAEKKIAALQLRRSTDGGQ